MPSRFCRVIPIHKFGVIQSHYRQLENVKCQKYNDYLCKKQVKKDEQLQQPNNNGSIKKLINNNIM